MWTSLIQYADWIWLACRTDPDLPRHKGLSMILVPADAPGFSYTPVHTVAGVSTSATYYEDVSVPASNLVGQFAGRAQHQRLRAGHARVQALSLINWKLAADADAGVDLSPAEASATKIYGSELATEVYRSLM